MRVFRAIHTMRSACRTSVYCWFTGIVIHRVESARVYLTLNALILPLPKKPSCEMMEAVLSWDIPGQFWWEAIECWWFITSLWRGGGGGGGARGGRGGGAPRGGGAN